MKLEISAFRPRDNVRIIVDAALEGDGEDAYPVPESWRFADGARHSEALAADVDKWLESDDAAGRLYEAWRANEN